MRFALGGDVLPLCMEALPSHGGWRASLSSAFTSTALCVQSQDHSHYYRAQCLS